MFECKLLKNDIPNNKYKDKGIFPVSEYCDDMLTHYYYKLRQKIADNEITIGKYIHPSSIIKPYNEYKNIINLNIEESISNKGIYHCYIERDQLIEMNTLSLLDYLSDIFDEVYLYKQELDKPQNLRIYIKLVNNSVKIYEDYRLLIPINLSLYIGFVMVVLANLDYLISISGKSNWKCKVNSKDLYDSYISDLKKITT